MLDLMQSNPEYDAKSTEQLAHDALTSGVSERAQSLFALSRRVTTANYDTFVEIIDNELNQEPMMFGVLPVRHAAIVALLINNTGEIRAKAERLWFDLSHVERNDLKQQLDTPTLSLPLRESEEAAIKQAIAVATDAFGPSEWRTSPTFDESGIVVKEVHPGRRRVIVAPDGSALFTTSSSTDLDDVQAFTSGARTPPEDFPKADSR